MSEQDLEKANDGTDAENATPDTTEEPPADAETVTQSASAASDITLQAALDAANEKAQNYFDGWQRERADFTNYKKRAERDLMTMRFNAKADTLSGLFPILDDFERAMDNLPEAMVDNPWLEGITAIQRKLLKALTDEGIEVLDPVGEPFDPTIHEAISRDSDSDMESGTVTATLQKGYIIGDRVLRPALVRVAE